MKPVVGALLALVLGGATIAYADAPPVTASPAPASPTSPTKASLACSDVAPVPDTLQVAWVSPVGARAGRHTPLEVVRVSDLRRLVEARGRDALHVLQALGLVGRHGAVHGAWKVTVFDVKNTWLCRPAEGEEGAPLGGVATCPSDWQQHGRGAKPRSFSGCGYLLDTGTNERSLDVFRVEWGDAVTWGFCVLPLDRFLQGA